MSILQKVAYNTIIQFIGKVISTIIGVVTIAIMARYLGKSGFGQYSTVMAYLQIFGILVDFGLSTTIIRLISDPQHDQTKIVNNILTIRLISAVVFLGVAPLVVLLFPYDNLIKIGVAITSLSYMMMSLNQVIIGVFQKELQLIKVTIAEVAGRLILLLLIIEAAYFNRGLLVILVAVVMGSLTNFALNYLFVQKFGRVKLAFDWDIWRKIFNVTWPIAISIAFNLVYFKADTLILSLIRSQAEVGIYSAPYRVLEILTNFIYMFMGIIFPLLTAYWTQKNYDKFKDLFQKCWDILVILAVPMVCGTFFVAKDLMLLIAGSEFSESGVALQLLMVATAFIFINSLFAFTIVTLDKQKQMVWVYVLVAFISLTGYLILIPSYGYLGAAVFTIISEGLVFIFNYYVTVAAIKFHPSYKIFLKAGAASILMSVFLYFIPNWPVLLQILMASLIYVFFIFLFKGIDQEIIRQLFKYKSQPEQLKV